MIPLTRLDGSAFHLNPQLIATMEQTPDTVVTLTTGASMMVRETSAVIIELIIAFQRRMQGAQ